MKYVGHAVDRNGNYKILIEADEDTIEDYKAAKTRNSSLRDAYVQILGEKMYDDILDDLIHKRIP